jgi:hypothetical protein
MSTDGKDEVRERRIPPEVFEILPKLLWFALAVTAFLLAYKPLLGELRSGDVSKISVATFQIEFARQDFATAAGQVTKGPPSPVQLKAFDDRIQRAGEKLIGAKGLWVSDNNADPTRFFLERRAFSALGISLDVALNNAQATALLDKAEQAHLPYDFVITDIHRQNDQSVADCFPNISGTPREAGCATVQIVEGYDQTHPIPVIVYSQDASRGIPPGALGGTDRFDGLVPLILDAVESRTLRPT